MVATPQHPILNLAHSKGVLRTRDVCAAGESRVALAKLVREGLLSKLGRGLYALPDRPFSENGALAEVSAKSEHGVVCLISALRFHELTTSNPLKFGWPFHIKRTRRSSTTHLFASFICQVRP